MPLLVGEGSGTFESYYFYTRSANPIELRYNDTEHIYYRVDKGKLCPVDGVTNTVHIIDKSSMLMPWTAKVMAQKLLANIPIYTTKDERQMVSAMPYQVFLTLLMDAKSAHKDRLEDAAGVGKDAHNFIEQFIKKELGLIDVLPPTPTDERAVNGINASLGWMDAHDVVWIGTERKVYSRTFNYAGTLDGLALCSSCSNPFCCPVPFKNKLCLIDWKTSNYLYLTYLLQTASYSYALMEEFPEAKIDHRFLIKLGKEDGKFESWHRDALWQDRDMQGFLTCLDLTRSMRGLKDLMAESDNERKASEKAIEQAARRAGKLKDCGKKDYKGVRSAKPKCVGELPCEKCLAIWQEKHLARRTQV